MARGERRFFAPSPGSGGPGGARGGERDAGEGDPEGGSADWGQVFAWLGQRGHRLADCLDLTLAQLRALIEGHRAVDSARSIALMAAVRVAFWADKDEATRWIDGTTTKAAAPAPDDIAAARRASLEAWGFIVADTDG